MQSYSYTSPAELQTSFTLPPMASILKGRDQFTEDPTRSTVVNVTQTEPVTLSCGVMMPFPIFSKQIHQEYKREEPVEPEMMQPLVAPQQMSMALSVDKPAAISNSGSSIISTTSQPQSAPVLQFSDPSDRSNSICQANVCPPLSQVVKLNDTRN